MGKRAALDDCVRATWPATQTVCFAASSAPALCWASPSDRARVATGSCSLVRVGERRGLKKTLPVAGLQAGDFVLFHAAAGGVGLIACQWAKALGYQLIGTAGSDAKCALAKDNGAAHVINYATSDFEARVKEITGGKGVKVVYDSVGKDTWEKSLNCLSPFGLMASFGNASGPVAPFAPGILGAKGSLYVTRQTLFTHIATRESTQAMADDLFDVVASGKVRIHIGQRYPLDEVQQAHRDLEARKTTGCTILTL
jgi:NADPH:quinone reductase